MLVRQRTDRQKTDLKNLKKLRAWRLMGQRRKRTAQALQKQRTQQRMNLPLRRQRPMKILMWLPKPERKILQVRIQKLRISQKQNSLWKRLKNLKKNLQTRLSPLQKSRPLLRQQQLWRHTGKMLQERKQPTRQQMTPLCLKVIPSPSMPSSTPWTSTMKLMGKLMNSAFPEAGF